MGSVGTRGQRRPSEIPQFAVARPRLERRLDEVRPGGLALVVAAAGSGKSVLLAQWAGRVPEKHLALVQLTSSDSDAVVCGRHLVDAVSRAVPAFPPELASRTAAGSASLGAAFIDGFLTALGAIGGDLVLVLDDLHAIDNAEVVTDLGAILTDPPRNVRSAVGSRWDPAFSVRAARLEGRLVEVRRSELAFDREEGGALLAAVSGRDIPAAHSEVLVDRTDGWAVGLQLAGVALRSQPDRAIGDVAAGGDPLVAEYLTEEVLDQQEPQVRRFLLRTSVLEWLSPDVCNAVTGGDDGRDLLDVVASRSLFLIPLDGRGERFRYHHLFADLLRLRLRAEDPTAPTELHRLAASWLLDHGHLEDAVDHLLLGGDHRRAFDLITGQGFRLFESGETASLVRWMEAIHRAEAEPSAVVTLNLLAAHIAADAPAAASETYRQLYGRGDLTPEERATADAYYATLVHFDAPLAEVARASHAVLDALPALDPVALPSMLGFEGLATVEGMARYGQAQAQLRQGDLVGAVAGFGEMLELPAMNYPVWRVAALGWSSIALTWSGQLTQAAQRAEEALAVGHEVGLVGHVSAAPSYLALTTIALDRGDLDAVEGWVHEAEMRTRRSRRPPLHALLRLVRARLLAAREGPWSALDLLRDSSSPRPLGSGLFATAAVAVEVRLLVTLGRLPEAETVLRRLGDDPVSFTGRIDLSLAADDVDGARRVLDRWTPEAHDLRTVVQHGIRTAAVLQAEGRGDEASSVLVDTLGRAEAEGLRHPFRVVPGVLQMLRDLPRPGPRSFASSILAVAIAPGARRAVAGAMVEPLTDREQSILVRLPTRLSSTDIAADLFISINTMKTHLRNIYRKLGVNDRDGAVACATELGLL